MTWYDIVLISSQSSLFIVKEELKIHHVVWTVVWEIKQGYGYFTLILPYLLVLCFSLICDSVLIEWILFLYHLSFLCSGIRIQLQNENSNYPVLWQDKTKHFNSRKQFGLLPDLRIFFGLIDLIWALNVFLSYLWFTKQSLWTDGPKLDFLTILNIKINALLWRV